MGEGQSRPHRPGWAKLSLIVPGKAEPPTHHPPSDPPHSACPNPDPASFPKSPRTEGSPGEHRSSGLLTAMAPAGNALPVSHWPTVHPVSPPRPACFLPTHLPLHISGFCTPRDSWPSRPSSSWGLRSQQGDSGSWGWPGSGRQCPVWSTAGTELPGPGL